VAGADRLLPGADGQFAYLWQATGALPLLVAAGCVIV